MQHEYVLFSCYVWTHWSKGHDPLYAPTQSLRKANSKCIAVNTAEITHTHWARGMRDTKPNVILWRISHQVHFGDCWQIKICYTRGTGATALFCQCKMCEGLIHSHFSRRLQSVLSMLPKNHRFALKGLTGYIIYSMYSWFPISSPSKQVVLWSHDTFYSLCIKSERLKLNITKCGQFTFLLDQM